MQPCMLHIGLRSRNDYLVKPMEKLAKEGKLKKNCSITFFFRGVPSIKLSV